MVATELDKYVLGEVVLTYMLLVMHDTNLDWRISNGAVDQIECNLPDRILLRLRRTNEHSGCQLRLSASRGLDILVQLDTIQWPTEAANLYIGFFYKKLEALRAHRGQATEVGLSPVINSLRKLL